MALEYSDHKYHRLLHKKIDREYADRIAATRNRVARLLGKVGVKSSSQSSIPSENILARESLIDAS